MGELERLLADRTLFPRTILCLNAHIYNLACGDDRLRGCLNAARLTLADGMAIVWAARMLGGHLPERCNMTEAYHAFLQHPRMPRAQAILVGCSEAEAEAAAARANQISRHCRIVAAYAGYLSDAECGAVFARHREIDVIFLGMGTPKTEFMAQLASQACPEAIVWGIGGGTIRIDARSIREAPVLWRRLGLQWLYRLAEEPGALWRRYLLGNPLFVCRMLKLAWTRKSHRPI